MKRVYRIYVLLIFILIIACEKDKNKDPGCEINGFWAGEWESGVQEQGNFLVYLKQNGTNIEGESSIRIFSDVNTTYSPSFSGTVKEKVLKSIINISGIDIYVDGSISDDSIVIGSFNVPDISLIGTYDGKKYRTTTPVYDEVYEFIPSSPGERIHDILFINGNLWLLIYPYEFVGDVACLKIIKMDVKCNTKGNGYVPYDGWDYSFDGENIWCVGHDSYLYKYDTLGNELENFELGDLSSTRVKSNNTSLFLIPNFHSILKTDHMLHVVDTISMEYGTSVGYSLYNNNFLVCNYQGMFKYNQQGILIEAYTKPEDYYITETVTNSDKIWCLAEIYLDEPVNENYSSFKIFEVGL